MAKRKGCDCIKSDVCCHQGNINSAFSGILEMRFGGTDPTYEKVTELVQGSCKYREQNKEERKKKLEKISKTLLNIEPMSVEQFKENFKKKKLKEFKLKLGNKSSPPIESK